LEQGVDVNIKKRQWRNRNFFALRLNNSKEMIEVLLAYGADINAKDRSGCTVYYG
jgi:hypothetical protein